MKRSIQVIGEALQALEFIFYVFIATALVAIGPTIWLYRLITADQFVGASVVGLIWLSSAAVVAREVRRKSVTVVSLSVCLAWLVVLVWVFNDWFM
jgi:hypothetical protein